MRLPAASTKLYEVVRLRIEYNYTSNDRSKIFRFRRHSEYIPDISSVVTFSDLGIYNGDYVVTSMVREYGATTIELALRDDVERRRDAHNALYWL